MTVPTLRPGSPEEAGLEARRLDRAVELLRAAAAADQLPGAVLLVARHGVIACQVAVGCRQPGLAMREDDVFLVASLTKPLVCLAPVALIERGELRLDDPAAAFLPALSGQGRERILIRHLLTHTSGLPDMLVEDRALRAAHAPLSAFVDAACRAPLAFDPGHGWQYQSMGILLLATVTAEIWGKPMPAILDELLAAPLGLRDTCLGVREDLRDQLVPVRLPAAARETDWHWNSVYWRELGVPWGGLHATATDLAVVLQMMLNGGRYGDIRVLSPAATAAAVADQTAELPDLPEADRRRHRWGLGWRLGGGTGEALWPDLLSPAAFGHTGSTGTMFWADPATGLLMVLLTNQPAVDIARLRAQVGTVVAGSWT